MMYSLPWTVWFSIRSWNWSRVASRRSYRACKVTRSQCVWAALSAPQRSDCTPGGLQSAGFQHAFPPKRLAQVTESKHLVSNAWTGCWVKGRNGKRQTLQPSRSVIWDHCCTLMSPQNVLWSDTFFLTTPIISFSFLPVMPDRIYLSILLKANLRFGVIMLVGG